MQFITLKNLTTWTFSFVWLFAVVLLGNLKLPLSSNLAYANGHQVASTDTADLLAFEAVADSSRQDIHIIGVVNLGPDTARNVTLTFPIPEGARFDRIQATTQMTCTLPPTFGTGEVVCSLGDLPPNKPTIINLYLSLVAPAGTKISAEAQVSSDTPDANPNNNVYHRDHIIAGVPSIISLSVLKDPFQIEVTGQNLIVPQFGGSGIGIGCDCRPWPSELVNKLPSGTVILKGSDLKKQFPKGVPTQICYIDPFRGTLIKTILTR